MSPIELNRVFVCHAACEAVARSALPGEIHRVKALRAVIRDPEVPGLKLPYVSAAHTRLPLISRADHGVHGYLRGLDAVLMLAPAVRAPLLALVSFD